MSVAFVIGNGVSRKGIDLAHLQSLGRVYGCNALYRDFTPDVLVATDRPIAAAIIESGYAKHHAFYTRKPPPESGARALIHKYHGYSSGPNAVALACADGNGRVYLLGFDMGPIGHNGFNNVYVDTEFYKTSRHPPTFTGNWVRQIVEICADYSHTQFIRVCGATTARIPELESVVNLTHQDLAEFADQLLS